MKAEAIAKKIKLVCLDVDGVLTDGSIIISGQGELFKQFYVRDGLGIKFLQDCGILPQSRQRYYNETAWGILVR